MDCQLLRKKVRKRISVMKTNTLCFQRIGILIHVLSRRQQKHQCLVFVFITEILWRTFWRNKWRSIFDVVKDSSCFDCLFFIAITLNLIVILIQSSELTWQKPTSCVFKALFWCLVNFKSKGQVEKKLCSFSIHEGKINSFLLFDSLTRVTKHDTKRTV